MVLFMVVVVFFFNDTATTEIYTLSLHDALPISPARLVSPPSVLKMACCRCRARSEEHTSELQSHHELVCRLLLEKKKKNHQNPKQQKKKNKKKIKKQKKQP